MKGIIYIRVSSDEQVKGTSLEFQEELCRKYCEQKGIEIVDVFREEGESAKDLSLNNRKKFLGALEFCRKNKNQIDAFIVLRVDRFARNTEDHFAVRKILISYGTTLHSVTEPIGNKPAEKFIETVLAGAAEYDNAIRKQRCTDGLLARINQGIYPFQPPLGYKCQHTKKHGLKKTEPDPPDDTTFSLVQKALKEYARGIYRQIDIVKLLDQWGLRSVSGKKPNQALVDRMLRKNLKFYTGIIVNPFTGKEKEGLHKPMITREEMFQIQLVLSNKGHKIMTRFDRFNPHFPLRRTVLCGSCGHPLTGSAPRGNGGLYYYYHCPNLACRLYAKGIPKKILEEEFVNFLSRIIPKYKFLLVFKESIIDLWKERGIQHEGVMKRHEAYLALLEAKRNRIFDMREDGSYTKDEFQQRKMEVENEIVSYQMALKSRQTDVFDIEKTLTHAIDFIGSLSQKWLILPLSWQRRFQKLVFPEGIPYFRNQGFGTIKLGYIFELISTFGIQKSSTVHLSDATWNQIENVLQEWDEATRGFEEDEQIQLAA